jgi:hypothetical protein
LEASEIFEHISSLSSVILLPFAIANRNKLEGRMKLLVWAIGVSVLSDAISLLLIKFEINMWPVGNLYVIIHFVLLFLILNEERKGPIWKLLFYGCITYALINYILFQTPSKFNSYTAYTTGILIIICALVSLHQMMNDESIQRIQTLPQFWLSFAVLVYYSGTLLIFLFNNYLSEHLPQIRLSLWIVHNTSNILKNVFFFTAIWVNYKSRTSPL